MAPTNNDAQRRRERLLAARADCLARMSEKGRRAFERRVTLLPRQQPAVPATCMEDHHLGHGALLTEEITNLIAETNRLRGLAEQQRDIRTAMKGLDTALKALALFGRTTGEIRQHGAPNVIVNVMATREEGIQTAAELLLELASAAELVPLIGQLQQRLVELEPFTDLSKAALPPAAGEALQPQLLAAAIPDKSDKKEEEGAG